MKLLWQQINPYEIHRIVYESMFADPDAEKPEKSRFLYTAIPDLGGMVLIRSASLPTHLHPYALPVEMPETGQTCGFELIAAPMWKQTITKPLPPNQPGLRFEWLARMGEMHGFKVQEASVLSERVWYDRKGIVFWLERAKFQGSLVVTDAAKLAFGLASGIGRARFLGHGMLRWV